VYAQHGGLGWIGKNSCLISPDLGSWIFLGEILCSLPLEADAPGTDQCGSCTLCLEACPTAALVAPGVLDSTRCISYLTIELRTAIPVEFRKALGNRIYGCDDCQLVCPWNKFARFAAQSDFTPRHGLDDAKLVELFTWSEEEFLARTEGSAIRRIGYECWLRNIAVALGNAPTTDEVVKALSSRREHPSEMVREHVQWALEQHAAGRASARQQESG
jgi:epoxyqueuosine reductase